MESENTNRDETLKLGIFIVLAFVVPTLGIGFAIYVLNYTRTNHVEKWMKVLAILALVFQALPLILALIAIGAFYTV